MNIFQVNPYTITTDKFDKQNMRYCESITSTSNGYMGVRGNFEETYSGDSLKGTYIAGIWYPDKTRVGWWKNGYPAYFGKVINTVNIIGIRVFVQDEEIDLSRQRVCDYHIELNMRNAVLERSAVVETEHGRIQIDARRFLSSADKSICAIRYSVTSLDKDVRVTMIPYLDFNVRNEDANYNEAFWDLDDEAQLIDACYVEGSTKSNPFNNNKFRVSAAMHVNVLAENYKEQESTRAGYADKTIVADINKGCRMEIEKIIAVCKSNEKYAPIKEHTVKMAAEAGKKGFGRLEHEHAMVFSEMMDSADVEIEGDESAQQGIRYNLFQLLCTYDGHDSRLNIGPKGLTGEKYGGAAYWDTEAFLIPFYLGVCHSKVARNLLLYRYHTLDKALENAKSLGLQGALYPMVTFDGHECHNEWEITFEEIHRNGAIAYAIFNYVTYTGDTDYLIEYGFGVLLEIARFWQSRVHFNKQKNVYMIHGVTGPNEYENNVNNNWYTNTMAKWCLEYTATVACKYTDRLQYDDDEIAQFRKTACMMYLPYDEERCIAVQHDTFLDKELKKADELNDAERPICRHWSWDKILRSCYIKQADVVQGLYALGHNMDRGFVQRNFLFYEPMTVHESSLSACVHSVVASRIGETSKAYELFHRAARLDLDDINHDTCDGLHVTSMSGAWLAITQGFAGMETINGELAFAPYLPERLKKYAFNIHYRNRLLRIEVSAGGVTISKIEGKDMELSVYGERLLLSDRISLPLK